MLDHSIVLAGAGLLAVCSLPVASAKRVCIKNSAGGQICRETLPTSVKVAIAVVTSAVVFLSLLLFFYIRRNRRASAEAAKEVTVEASQMEGPATVLRATYNPGSGHSIYAIGTSGSGAIPTSVIPPSDETPVGATLAPAFPTPTAQRPPTSYSQSPGGAVQPRTAPAHKSTFSGSQAYPFVGMGRTSGSSQPPKSAFVSHTGFPRPLLAGRLKDRIRERPDSLASVSVESPNK